MQSIVSVSEAAAERLAALAARAGARAMRLSVAPGGCRGTGYALEPDMAEQSREPTILVNQYVCVPHAQLGKLAGLHIDWVETPLESKFQFKNPNAKQSCSCGKSFSC